MTVTAPSATRTTQLTWLPWALTSIVVLLGIYVWANSFSWQFSTLSTYTFFPVLGLLAFSIMWSQTVIGEIHKPLLRGVNLHTFFKWTGTAVLVLIVLHPGLLIYQRFRDGFGLPPHSYETYVAPSMAWITLLGSVSLLIFLSFELRRWFAKKGWWKYVLYLNDIALLAIFYHGLELGTQTHIMWFKYVWWFYGITLAASLLHKYILRIQQHSTPAS